MYQVFEMSQSSNIDDPAKIIEVQQKVKELLDGNRFRQAEIKKEIIAMGPWAVPGLINSLYVYMHLLKADQGAQMMMTDILITQAGTNEAAGELLFRTGVLESPFAVPRSVALNVLEKRNWKPTNEQLGLVKSRIEEAQRLEDQVKEMDLYRLLALGQDEKDLTLLLGVCKRMIREEREFGNLLAIITQAYPRRAEMIVAEILLAAEEQYSKDRNIAEHIAKALGPVSTDQNWLAGDFMLNLSGKTLLNKKTASKGHKSLEHLWSEVLKASIRDKATEQMGFLRNYGQRMKEKSDDFQNENVRQTIYRFWFEAVERAGGGEYIMDEALEQDDDWCRNAVLQLFFMRDRGNRTAADVLEQVRMKKSQRWEDAENLYTRIKVGKSDSSWEDRRHSEGGGVSRK